MKLGVLSFLAALLAAPLAAQAAESQARFAVTLQATIADKITYEMTRVEEECRVQLSGTSGQARTVRSVRRTRMEVGTTVGGVSYRPSWVAARSTGRTTVGSFEESRICRAAPIERRTGECEAKALTPRRLRARVQRPGPDRLAFRTAASARAEIRVCGLGQPYPGGWLDLAPGRVDENALLNGRSLRVVARGSVRKTVTLAATASVKISRRTTVRWTLIFRRLG
jgi:hypothetical protein